MGITLIERKTKRASEKESEYKSALSDLESVLSEYILFEFSIEYLPGDGFCIMLIDNHSIAPLKDCVTVIKNKGQLSTGDHESHTI